MKEKIVLFIICIIPLLTQAQFHLTYPQDYYEKYYNSWNSEKGFVNRVYIANVHSEGSELQGNFCIRTNIPAENENYTTIFIKGYDKLQGTINLQIGWHWTPTTNQTLGTYEEIGENYEQSASVSTSGSYNPKIQIYRGNSGTINISFLGEENNLYLQDTHFEISAILNGEVNRNLDPNYFMYWTVDNEEVNLVNEIYTCSYINRFKDIIAEDVSVTNLGAFNGTLNNLTVSNNRNYYVNKEIPGSTVDNVISCPNTNYNDACTKSYLLLHKAYNGEDVPTTVPGLSNSQVQGKITAIRGGIGEWNYTLAMEVNTSTAYNTTRGSLINYSQEGVTKLVTVTYNTERYLAIEINHPSAIYRFSFTGYAENERLQLVSDNITNIQPFTSVLDPISLQGPLRLENLKNTSTDNVLSTNADGKVVLVNGEGYWKKHSNINSVIVYDGIVGIGLNTTSNISNIISNNYKLLVDGTIGVRKVRVTQQNSWADYVFKKEYKLMSLTQLEKFIKTNGHLPEVPTENEIAKNGNDIGDTQVLLLKKIEELTMYIIQQQKEIDALKNTKKKIK